MGRPIYFMLGVFCLILAAIGVPLPLLPTTPFVLLAAFCFSRSSKTLHQRLLNNKIFGPMIMQWETYGIIPMRAKLFATVMMLTMVSYPIFFKDLPIWAIAGVVTTIALSLTYIWTRPSEAEQKTQAQNIESSLSAEEP